MTLTESIIIIVGMTAVLVIAGLLFDSYLKNRKYDDEAPKAKAEDEKVEDKTLKITGSPRDPKTGRFVKKG